MYLTKFRIKSNNPEDTSSTVLHIEGVQSRVGAFLFSVLFPFLIVLLICTLFENDAWIIISGFVKSLIESFKKFSNTIEHF